MGLVLESDTWKLQSDADWYVEYTVDFTTQSSAAIAHNETFSLGAQTGDGSAATWTAEEDDTGDTDDAIGTLEWVAGSGLKVTPATGTNTWNQGLDSPCLTVALSDCIPNLTSQDVICVQAFTAEPVTLAANHDGYGIVLYDPAADLASVSKWIYYRNYYTNGARYWQVSGNPTNAAGTNDAGGVATVPRSFEIVAYLTGGSAICAHSTSTDTSAVPLNTISTDRAWVEAADNPLSSWGTFSEPTMAIDPDDWRLALMSFKVASGTSFYNYFSSVRILRLGGLGGGAD